MKTIFFASLVFATLNIFNVANSQGLEHSLSDPTELNSGHYFRDTKIQKNQTLASTLRAFKLDENTIYELNKGFSDFINLKRVSIGTKITGEFRALPLAAVTKIIIRHGKTKTVIANQQSKNNWKFKSLSLIHI